MSFGFFSPGDEAAEDILSTEIFLKKDGSTIDKLVGQIRLKEIP